MDRTSAPRLRLPLTMLSLLAAATLSLEAQAYSVAIPAAEIGQGRHAAAVTVGYGGAAQAVRVAYPGPAGETETEAMAAPASDAQKVEGWQLLLAVLGLVGMRMWRAGKKSLPLIG